MDTPPQTMHTKATPFSESADLSCTYWLSQLQLVLKRGSDAEDLGLQGPMLFCTTCMGRGQQLLVALAVNLCMAFPYRRCVKFCILLLGDDDEGVWQDIESHFGNCIDEGWLLVASGGAAGRRAAQQGVDAPAWMPDRPGGIAAGTGRAGPQQLRYWHASWAKNGAHQFAMWAAGNSAKTLVNLDCDNLMTPEYISGLAAHFRKGAQVEGLCVVCRNVEGALTGRLAYRPVDFLHLRGYDTEGTSPAASEDCDLRERLLALAERKAGRLDRPTQRPSLIGPSQCGSALANDLTNLSRRVDRSTAKLANVDPLILQRFGTAPQKRFAAMCHAAWSEVYGPRLLAGRFIRNDRETCAGELWYCCWWTCLRRPRPSGEAEPTESPARWGGVEPPGARRRRLARRHRRHGWRRLRLGRRRRRQRPDPSRGRSMCASSMGA